MAMDKNIKLTINGKSNNEIKKACGEICGDNRFEIIEKYKKKLIETTNIETSEDEMSVIDNILFRFWQMKWLYKLDEFDRLKLSNEKNEKIIKLADKTIKAQSAEIEKLNAEIERLQYIKKHINDVILEDCVPETPEAYNMCFQKLIKKLTNTKAAKSEAIKEFEYRITLECAKVMTIFQLDVMKEIIEDVKQEMVGDDNG